MKYRVTGKFGSDDIPVQTDWLDIPEGEAKGLEIGMKLRGWTDVGIEGKEEGQ